MGFLRRGRVWLWLGPTLVWLAFCFWYTNTAGAFTPEETAAVTAQLRENGASPERIDQIKQFMTGDAGGQFLMVNLLYSAPGEGADESMDRYMAHMLPAMLKRASHPMLFGPVVAPAMDLAGIEGAQTWTTVGVVRYRSRRDLLAIAFDPVFNDKHEFKLGALTKTIAVPVEPALYLSDPRMLLLLVLLAVVGLVNAFWRRHDHV